MMNIKDHNGQYFHRIIFALLLLVSHACRQDISFSENACQAGEWIENTAPIEVYCDKISYAPGETVQVKGHCLLPWYNAYLIRYGLHNELMDKAGHLPGIQQDYQCYDYSQGCSWHTTAYLKIPDRARSGIYAVKLSDSLNHISYFSFVVRRTPAQAPEKIVVIASTNTWQAYNKWGGGSFYRHYVQESVRQSQILSFLRPNPYAPPTGYGGHLAAAELHLHRWLEQQGYEYETLADIDLHNNPAILKQYKVVIFNVHSEYWTMAMMNGVLDYLAGGGKIMFLCANSAYWRVALTKDRIEVRKSGTALSYDEGKSGYWSDLGYPGEALMGVTYSHDGYGTYAPYRVLADSSWIFAETGLHNNDLFGTTCLNGDGTGASGSETDKITTKSPSGLIHLAKGINPDAGGADMVYFTNRVGGAVFSSGSVVFTGSLATDTAVSRITANVLDHFLQ